MIGLAIGGVILWAIAVVWGKKAAAWVVLVVCTVLVFAIALVIGRQLSGDIFDQIHAEHQAASGSQFGGIPVNQFGDPVFTPPPLSSHQKPAATDEFGAVMWLAIGLGASVGLGCTLLVFILMGGLR
jgi:Na+(H+)/acetate symporter ActP